MGSMPNALRSSPDSSARRGYVSRCACLHESRMSQQDSHQLPAVPEHSSVWCSGPGALIPMPLCARQHNATGTKFVACSRHHSNMLKGCTYIKIHIHMAMHHMFVPHLCCLLTLDFKQHMTISNLTQDRHTSADACVGNCHNSFMTLQHPEGCSQNG